MRLLKKLKRRYLALVFKIDFIRFFLYKNRDWDFSYLLEIIYKKLTAMGITIYRNDLIVEKKKVVRSIWQARKYLKLVIADNYWEIRNNIVDSALATKYNTIVTRDLDITDSTLNWKYTANPPVDDAKLAEIIADKESLDKFVLNHYFDRQADLERFLSCVAKDIWMWWD